MQSTLIHWVGTRFKRMVNSIAFYPAFIALMFLALSYIMISIDFSETGKQIKAQMEWLKLKDASTARSVISVIAAGVLSLTVFSFTMVMVILNQAASQMSNRVLDEMIGNRLQQVILGFYIGTIVYSLFLLSAIRDIDSGIYVPALSTYVLIAFAIIDIFLFIYFLHYITQSVKYSVIIHRIHKQTRKALQESCRLRVQPEEMDPREGFTIYVPKSGIFNGFDKSVLMTMAAKHNCSFSFLHPKGTYVLEGVPLLTVSSVDQLSKDEIDDILLGVSINNEQSIDINMYYGFRQLTEVALKALSPGINDPGTAVESLRALTDLMLYRLQHFPDNVVKDEEGVIRIVTKEPSFETVFINSIIPIWDYGKEDRFIQQEMKLLLSQLQKVVSDPSINKLLVEVQKRIHDRSHPAN